MNKILNGGWLSRLTVVEKLLGRWARMPARGVAAKGRARRPALECLEERLTPATFAQIEGGLLLDHFAHSGQIRVAPSAGGAVAVRLLGDVWSVAGAAPAGVTAADSDVLTIDPTRFAGGLTFRNSDAADLRLTFAGDAAFVNPFLVQFTAGDTDVVFADGNTTFSSAAGLSIIAGG